MAIINDIEPIVIGGIGEKKSNNGTQWYQQDRIYSGGGGYLSPLPHHSCRFMLLRRLRWKIMKRK